MRLPIMIVTAVLAVGFSTPIFGDDHNMVHEDTKLVTPAGLFVGEIEISGAFTRAMPPAAKSGGGYITLINHGAKDDRLVSVTSSAALVAQLHEMRIENDVMIMRHRKDGIIIPAGEIVVLAPGGLHIMFMQVPTPFAQGTDVPVTLMFEYAGKLEIVLPVAPIGASGPVHAH